MLNLCALRALVCFSVLLAACGDDAMATDTGPLPDIGGLDIDRADTVGCVPRPGAIFEPLWIAGQTGTFEEVGAFGRPDAIFVDGDRLLAGDEDDERDELHIYDLTSDDPSVRGDFLTPLADIGTKGPGELEFWGIAGMAQDAASGSIFVVENRNARVQVLSRLDEAPYYAYEREIGFKSEDFEMTPPGEFQTPQAARTDSMGRLYVSDDAQCACSGAARRDVQVFTPEGEFISVFGDGPREGVGTLGNLAEPENFVIDEARDRIYVCDEVPEDIAIFRYSDNTFVRRFGDLIGNPNGIDMDASGNLYVVDEGNQLTTTVRVFEPDGLTEIYNFGELSTEDDLTGGYFNSPDTLIIDIEQDLLIVADQGHDRIQGFSLSEIRAAGCIP
jgi:DNA-binding beta-propeller fold protein YncE